jgi:hypothetical protein
MLKIEAKLTISNDTIFANVAETVVFCGETGEFC